MGEQAYGEGDGTQNTEESPSQLLKLGIQLIDAPPGPAFILVNLGTQVVGVGIVHIRKVHSEHFVRQHMVFAVGKPGGQRIYPVLQRSNRERQQGAGDQSGSYPFPKHLRSALGGQLVQNPGGKPDGYVGADGFPGGIER